MPREKKYKQQQLQKQQNERWAKLTMTTLDPKNKL